MSMTKGTSIHKHMTEKFELAQIYAQDGAFHSAARVLRDLAADVGQHAEACDAMMDTALEEGTRMERAFGDGNDVGG